MPTVPVGAAFGLTLQEVGFRLRGAGYRSETADGRAPAVPLSVLCKNLSRLRFEDLQIGGELLTLGFRAEIHRDHVHDE